MYAQMNKHLKKNLITKRKLPPFFSGSISLNKRRKIIKVLSNATEPP
jgi:hypothetical protein